MSSVNDKRAAITEFHRAGKINSAIAKVLKASKSTV